jgi:ACT domain-containing protein
MGELGTENRVLPLIKSHPHALDKELMETGGIARGTFYKYKGILQRKGLISI